MLVMFILSAPSLGAQSRTEAAARSLASRSSAKFMRTDADEAVAVHAASESSLTIPLISSQGASDANHRSYRSTVAYLTGSSEE